MSARQFPNEPNTESNDFSLPQENFSAPLDGLGLIAASGEDAAGFLHNQLTNDITHLASGQARLAGYCSAKGRLLATFLVWKTDEGIMLQLPREIQASVQKRLQMFVLRAKAKLTDADYSALGLVGFKSERALRGFFPELPASSYSTIAGENGLLIRVADSDGLPRYQWIAPKEKLHTASQTLTETLPRASERAWRLSEIRAGIPQIMQITQEQFVPQMVNYELIGGVNFKKGCYPGQEIVARSQYLGKLKRRMMLASVAAADAAAGSEVFSDADPEQPCGMIVNAERESNDRSLCLVELKLAAIEEGAIHLGSPSGPALEFRPMPYDLPDSA